MGGLQGSGAEHYTWKANVMIAIEIKQHGKHPEIIRTKPINDPIELMSI